MQLNVTVHEQNLLTHNGFDKIAYVPLALHLFKAKNEKHILFTTKTYVLFHDNLKSFLPFQFQEISLKVNFLTLQQFIDVWMNEQMNHSVTQQVWHMTPIEKHYSQGADRTADFIRMR